MGKIDKARNDLNDLVEIQLVIAGVPIKSGDHLRAARLLACLERHIIKAEKLLGRFLESQDPVEEIVSSPDLKQVSEEGEYRSK